MRDVRPFFTERYFLKKKIACFLTCKYNDNRTFEKCTEYMKGWFVMAVSIREDYRTALEEQRMEVREMVLAGLKEVKAGKTKDFSKVCDRLEKKYRDAAVQN